MLEEQLIPGGITNQRVLDAFRKIERHKFIPEEMRTSAYADFPVPIGEGQTISQPYIVALMTECLDLTELLSLPPLLTYPRLSLNNQTKMENLFYQKAGDSAKF